MTCVTLGPPCEAPGHRPESGEALGFNLSGGQEAEGRLRERDPPTKKGAPTVRVFEGHSKTDASYPLERQYGKSCHPRPVLAEFLQDRCN